MSRACEPSQTVGGACEGGAWFPAKNVRCASFCRPVTLCLAMAASKKTTQATLSRFFQARPQAASAPETATQAPLLTQASSATPASAQQPPPAAQQLPSTPQPTQSATPSSSIASLMARASTQGAKQSTQPAKKPDVVELDEDDNGSDDGDEASTAQQATGNEIRGAQKAMPTKRKPRTQSGSRQRASKARRTDNDDDSDGDNEVDTGEHNNEDDDDKDEDEDEDDKLGSRRKQPRSLPSKVGLLQRFSTKSQTDMAHQVSATASYDYDTAPSSMKLTPLEQQ